MQNSGTSIVLPPFLFTCRQLVHFSTNRQHVKRNGGSSILQLTDKDYIPTRGNQVNTDSDVIRRTHYYCSC
jgi:hypothetical protein